MFRHLVFFLLTHFALGLLFTTIFVSRLEIGKLYFKVTSWIAFTLIALALLAQPFGNFRLLDLESNGGLIYIEFTVSCFLLLLYNLIPTRIHKIWLIAAFLFGCAGVVSFMLLSAGLAADLGNQALMAANGIASALLLGSVLGAMITGHWYLVKHDLSLAPLKSASLIFIFSVTLRILLLIVTLAFFARPEAAVSTPQLITSFDFQSMIFWGRVCVGLLIPFVFGIMVWQATKIRSTQSATGILYATIVLVLIGETFSRFLFFWNGLPL